MLSTPAALHPFSVCHWNVNEMRSSELRDPKNERIQRICQTILDLNQDQIPDFCSIQEIQYDFPYVPRADFQTTGKNLDIFFDRLVSAQTKDEQQFSPEVETFFHSGNCGILQSSIDPKLLVQPIDGDTYLDDRNPEVVKKLQFGDLVNCVALVPGQYGVGFWSKYKIENITAISHLRWKDFHPSIDFSSFRLPKRPDEAEGAKIPEDITLFDKCLLLAKVRIVDKVVNFLITHTMPSYGFGNPATSNFARNNDQLALIEWLVKGTTYFEPPKDLKDDDSNLLRPISPEEPVIIMGDLNVDFRSSNSGAERLRSLIHQDGFTAFPHGRTTSIGHDVEFQLDYLISRKVNLDAEKGRFGPISFPDLSDHACLLAHYQV